MNTTIVPLKTVQFAFRWKATSVPSPSQNMVIGNLCEKLKCTEIVAKNIYDECPTLRSVDAIQNDSLQMLSKNLSLLSIVENPELVTMDLGEIDFILIPNFIFIWTKFFRFRRFNSFALETLTRKIELIYAVEPKNLDDFAPLLQIKEKELRDIVYKRMLKERDEVGIYGNRIYYISDKLQVNIFS